MVCVVHYMCFLKTYTLGVLDERVSFFLINFIICHLGRFLHLYEDTGANFWCDRYGVSTTYDCRTLFDSVFQNYQI